MRKIFKEAHKMTREIASKYEVDYQAQFGLCLAYLLENKEEKEMIKNYVEEKGLRIEVDGNKLNYYKDNKLVAETWGFTNEDSIKDFGDTIGVRFHIAKDFLKKYSNIRLKKETYTELVQIREDIKIAIDKYFENLDNVKLEKLSNGSIVFSERTDRYKELKVLDEDYFHEVEEDWIRDNKKYFTVEKGYNKDDFGMMHPYTNYFFTKDNIVEVDKKIAEHKQTEEYKEKMKKKEESNNRFNELCKLAETMNNVDFEDVTGLSRENYLI